MERFVAASGENKVDAMHRMLASGEACACAEAVLSAARGKSVGAMRLLAAHGAPVLSARDEHGRTPLMVACMYKKPDALVRLLVGVARRLQRGRCALPRNVMDRILQRTEDLRANPELPESPEGWYESVEDAEKLEVLQEEYVMERRLELQSSDALSCASVDSDFAHASMDGGETVLSSDEDDYDESTVEHDSASGDFETQLAALKPMGVAGIMERALRDAVKLCKRAEPVVAVERRRSQRLSLKRAVQAAPTKGAVAAARVRARRADSVRKSREEKAVAPEQEFGGEGWKPPALDFVNEVDNGGNTALIIACRNSNPRVVTLLLRHGANPSIANKSGINPLLSAVSRRTPFAPFSQLDLQVFLRDRRGCINAVIDHVSASVARELVLQESGGWCALTNACRMGTAMQESFFKMAMCVDLAKEVNKVHHNNTLLGMTSSASVASLLVSCGADVRGAGGGQPSCLQVACAEGRLGVAIAILRKPHSAHDVFNCAKLAITKQHFAVAVFLLKLIKIETTNPVWQQIPQELTK